MREALGEACNFIDDEKFLPMFRNRQKNWPEEFELSVKLAKKKTNASKYFASIWGVKNLKESLAILRKMISRAKSKLAERLHNAKIQARINSANKGVNYSLREKFENMKRERLSRSLLRV